MMEYHSDYHYKPVWDGTPNNLKEIETRMNGWQLESFKESYNHKKNNGISLYKKKLNEQK